MSHNQKHLYILIMTLFVVGIVTFAYRHFVLDVPLSETEAINSWTIEANLKFRASKNVPVKATFTIPYKPPYYSILDEYFVSQNYGVATNLSGYNRVSTWTLRRGGGKQSLYYRAILRQVEDHIVHLPKPSRINSPELSEHQKTAVNTIITEARQASADIVTFAQATIKYLKQENGNAKLLVGPKFDDQNIANAAVTVLNQAKIFAIPVHGIYLNKNNKADFKTMLAVYNEKSWMILNPLSAQEGLPKNFLVWQYGNDPIFELTGGKTPNFTITISPTPINALSIVKLRGSQTESQLLKFSLLQLPINVQETYKILLMVPIGAFIILILRNFIGLSTFGTFMPVLIALAFRETHVIWGITLFTFIVSVGLLVRFYLDELRLLLVPRLAAVLTVVILLMVFMSVFSQKLGLDSGLSVALFPMVILTMTIERMCILWDERGPFEAIKAGSGSMLAAVICYFAMSIPALQYLVFAFPELLLVLLGLILWAGQYKGYRLFELARFKELAS